MSAVALALGRQLAKPEGAAGWLLGQAMRVVNRRPVRFAIDALEIQPGDVVLDLGCGCGDAFPRLLREAWSGRVHGLDHAVEMATEAKERHPDAQVHVGSFSYLPFTPASVDRILAVNVAYFWHDHRLVLDELLRVLRPRGRLAVYVTQASHLRRIGLAATGTHRLFDAGALQEMLGPTANVKRVDAGFGVGGLIATLDR